MVERSSGDHSGRTSVGIPRERKSVVIEQEHGQEEAAAIAHQDPEPEMASPVPAPAKESEQQVPLPMADANDLEAGGRLRRSPSRASIPTTPPPPADATAGVDGPEEEEFSWGPSHPCFPHMNPHVPLTSSLYHSTRIIRVKRDWMQAGDLAPTFANLYPEVLDPLVSEGEFRNVVRHINAELIAAFTPWSVRAWADALLGAATLWLYDDLGLPAIRQRLHRLEEWIALWNRDVGEKEGVKIISLRRTAYMTVRPHSSSTFPAHPVC